MSTPFRLFLLIASFALLVPPMTGQQLNATIELDFKTSPAITVRGRNTDPGTDTTRRNLAFRRAVAGEANLASRISELSLSDAAGNPVTFRKLMDGEYLSDADFAGWQYKVDISSPRDRTATAHASWFADGTGILMLADLLPQFGSANDSRPARITFKMAADSDAKSIPIYTAEPERAGVYEVADTSDAVFYVGENWHRAYLSGNASSGSLLISGTWNFETPEASAMVKEVHDAYEKLLGSNVAGAPFIAIAKFPIKTPPGEWQAETRGRSATIISSDMPFRSQSLQRLHEQLRHELFHLWIPNGVNLTGNYDWFYEGFALYESLKLAVTLNRIRFEDFLDTLSRAHTIDSAGSQRTALIQMSVNRFSGANTQLYARGMLVAFLCDLALLEQSKGKRSAENILKGLFTRHRKPAAAADANTSVLALLKSNPSVSRLVEKYIEGAEKLDWAAQIGGAGIEDSDPGPLTNLRVKEKLTGRQRALLDKLGYNNWRKLTLTRK
jgi:hypothetical protein